MGSEELEDLAEMAGIEYLLIDGDSSIRGIKKELRMNEVYYYAVSGFNHAG
jgi:L-arabinose isomerase